MDKNFLIFFYGVFSITESDQVKKIFAVNRICYAHIVNKNYACV